MGLSGLKSCLAISPGTGRMGDGVPPLTRASSRVRVRAHGMVPDYQAAVGLMIDSKGVRLRSSLRPLRLTVPRRATMVTVHGFFLWSWTTCTRVRPPSGAPWQ